MATSFSQSTYTRPRGRGFSIIDPDNQRREAVAAAMAALRRDCGGWIRTQFQGEFGSGLTGGEFPSCLLVTLDQAVPLDSDARPSWWSYVTQLGLGADHEAWESADLPGLRLRVPDGDDPPSHWLLAGRRDQVLPNLDPMYGGSGRSAWANYLHPDFDRTLALLLGSPALLAGYHARIARARDAVGRGGRVKGVRTIAELEGDLGTIAGDIHPVATELAMQFKEPWIGRERIDFTPGAGHIVSRLRQARAERRAAQATVARRPSPLARLITRTAPHRRHGFPATETETEVEKVPSLVAQTIERLERSARRLAASETIVREALDTVATMRSARETLALNRTLNRATCLLVGFTLALLAVGIAQLWATLNPSN